jgi:hypothetical protein
MGARKRLRKERKRQKDARMERKCIQASIQTCLTAIIKGREPPVETVAILDVVLDRFSHVDIKELRA